MLIIILILLCASIISAIWFFYQFEKKRQYQNQALHENLSHTVYKQVSEEQLKLTGFLSSEFSKARLETQTQLQQTLQYQNKQMLDQLEKLSTTVYTQLKDIGGLVEQKLSQGFEKTQQTFADIVKRLALIDEAQKRITELSSNVVSLQSLLADKRSRGAFGEIQLNQLLENTLPAPYYELQAVLSNNRRADCLLKLPGKIGNMVIDAKFPLESYQNMMNLEAGSADRKMSSQQFVRDIKKHITDIAERYIIFNETAESAIMFIPAEAIFAEIHGHYPELVTLSHQRKVWLASPSTMMAILTTVSAVIKDEQTKEQMHIIQEHLVALSKDFHRFQKRMDGLQKHIAQANEDVQSVNVSARKISARFEKIEQVQLEGSTVGELAAKKE